MRPLYKETQGVAFEKGHAGLWYDKFCDRWPQDWASGLGESKLIWISELVKESVGDVELIEDYHARRTRLIEAARGVSLGARTVSRFVTGLGRAHPVENGFAWHATLGAPYLPGSSIKGLIRAWAKTTWVSDAEETPSGDAIEQQEVDARLGSRGMAGDILVLDALPLAPVKLEADVMTPHYGDYYRGDDKPPGDWMSPNPVPFLVVSPGSKFQFGLLPRTAAARAHLARVAGWLEGALAWLGAGAKTAIGYGTFCCDVPLPNPAERWLSPVERWRQHLEERSEQEALELALQLSRKDEASGDGGDEALREALIARYYEAWAKGEPVDRGTTHSKRKLKEYAAYLRPSGETEIPHDDGADAGEAACIESCRGNKTRIKEIGERIMAGTGPIRTERALKAFARVARDKLAKGKKADKRWLKDFLVFLEARK